MTPPRLSLTAMLIAVTTLFALTAFSGDCMRLCEREFMRDATAQEIQAEIKRGADIRGRDNRGFTTLHYAAYEGNAEVVTALLAAGEDIEAKANFNSTPLHVAAGWGGPEVVIALIEAGANGKARNEEGDTPFDLAKDNEQLKGTEAYWLLNEARY